MCVRGCRRLAHWGPMIALGIIKWISVATVYGNATLWPLDSGWTGTIYMFSFCTFATLTSFHFFCAMCEGPGYLPLGWKPNLNEDEKYLQFCESCNAFKAPRAHHCRKCNRCVMKMDHHCPWINNCVGHFNHGHFIAFLFFAVVGCAQATFTLAMTLYYGLHRTWYLYYGTGLEPKVNFTLWTLLLVMFGLGLAIGVVLAVGALLFFQLRSVWRNQTGIEDWIIDKANYRRREKGVKFQHPYHLGNWKNFREVISMTCIPEGNGIEWKLREGSNKYDLTIEQLEQKADKRQRTKEYVVVQDFSGSWFPLWSSGFRVAFHPPCSDEPRIQLKKGDQLKVTRWKKYWLYGDKNEPKSDPGHRVRGWFPRSCVVEAADEFSNLEEKEAKKRESKKLK